jgi:chorismate synthase
VAKKLLAGYDISVIAYIREIGGIAFGDAIISDLVALRSAIDASPLRCPHVQAEESMKAAILRAKEEGDSLGGIVECVSSSLPTGLGDPIYEKLEAKLAAAMLSIPASKGFEIGEGFAAARMRGSQHNDGFFRNENGLIRPRSNRAGGTLAGISTGLPLKIRVAFKPTSSIATLQETTDLEGTPASFFPGPEARHDPCVAIRGVAVVEAMAALVLADALLLHKAITL